MLHQYQEIPPQLLEIPTTSLTSVYTVGLLFYRNVKQRWFPLSMLFCILLSPGHLFEFLCFFSIDLLNFKTLFTLLQALWHVSTYSEYGSTAGSGMFSELENWLILWSCVHALDLMSTYKTTTIHSHDPATTCFHQSSIMKKFDRLLRLLRW